MSEKKFLKNCPLCGGEATTHCNKVLSKGEHKKIYGVMCKKTYCCYIPAEYYTKEEAIEKWNTRVPMEKIVERLEKLNKYEETGDCPKDGMCSSRRCHGCYSNSAIEIVKQEGGLNDSNTM